jgi:UDP-4-amino-4,6-dideoxy-N-acetyl-beta-L-altrosamine transaminase
MIPYGRQNIDQADVDAVIGVLRSESLTQGPGVPAFEKMVASFCEAKHAVAVNSATSALHLACLALGVGAGDLVWTSPITFVASANCARYCGAAVDFVDIDPATYNLSVAALARKLEGAEKAGRLPKVVIPVHMGGQSCDMAAIHALGQQYGFRIIEDASHAIGGKYRAAPIGGCRFSDITVFSFHPVKIITTGEGGMAVTNDAGLAGTMRRLRSHGITREAGEMTHTPDGPWYYQQLDLGFNYRMNDIQAALGTSQMKRLEEFVSARTSLARRYDELLSGLPLSVPRQHADALSAWHLYVIRLNLAACKDSHAGIFQKLRQAGIGVNLHYIPVHLQPYYRDLGFQEGYCPEAERYYGEAISLPIFPGLTAADQGNVVTAISRILVG